MLLGVKMGAKLLIKICTQNGTHTFIKMKNAKNVPLFPYIIIWRIGDKIKNYVNEFDLRCKNKRA